MGRRTQERKTKEKRSRYVTSKQKSGRRSEDYKSGHSVERLSPKAYHRSRRSSSRSRSYHESYRPVYQKGSGHRNSHYHSPPRLGERTHPGYHVHRYRDSPLYYGRGRSPYRRSISPPHKRSVRDSHQHREYSSRERRHKSRNRSLDHDHQKREFAPIGYVSDRNRRRIYRKISNSHSKSSSDKKTSDSQSSTDSSQVENSEDYTEQQKLEKLLGVTQFDSSKGKNHSATDLWGVNKKTKRRYRQYMNRRGGFNRPLSPVF